MRTIPPIKEMGEEMQVTDKLQTSHVKKESYDDNELTEDGKSQEILKFGNITILFILCTQNS